MEKQTYTNFLGQVFEIDQDGKKTMIGIDRQKQNTSAKLLAVVTIFIFILIVLASMEWSK